MPTRTVLALVGLAMLVASCGGGTESGNAAGDGAAGGDGTEIPGLQTFGDLGRTHVTGSVAYTKSPPVGGNHFRNLQTCGAYDKPVPKELAVHSMEHGAVWLTYRPGLPANEIDRLRREARQPYVLLSPYPDLPVPSSPPPGAASSGWTRRSTNGSSSSSRSSGAARRPPSRAPHARIRVRPFHPDPWRPTTPAGGV